MIRPNRTYVFGCLLLIALVLAAESAFAQSGRHPFAIAGGEGGGASGGLLGLVLAWQSRFHTEMEAAVRALKTSRSAFWTLGAASFAYGVFHAAGPGHGKAVLASYMIANETALKRGLLLASFAALLQGAIAILIVCVAAIALNATARQMQNAAGVIEVSSYIAIALFGARLAWIKGGALIVASRAPVTSPSGFSCEAVDDPSHAHGPQCGHLLALDPKKLGAGFSWLDATGTVFAAGLRPCSGAILVLVFTLSQGLLAAGAAAVLLMSAGTAITTGALAAAAVYAKGFAMRFGGKDSRRAVLVGRGAELIAALLVLGMGLALLAGLGLARGQS